MYAIYGDNLVETMWFKSLSSLLHSAQIEIIGRRGTNPTAVEALIEYDRPDIILLNDGCPVLVVEKTREVPTGHNVGQRVARLVRAIELGVPTIKFFPFDARKHGDYSSICNLNIRLLAAFEKMTAIHAAPIMAVNWPADKFGELIDDGSEDSRMRQIVHGYLKSQHNIDDTSIKNQIREMGAEYQRRLTTFPKYGAPPGKSVYFMATEDLLAKTHRSLNGAGSTARFKLKKKSLIYRMAMTPEKCRREDPYTGTQFIYDYLWCRAGKGRDQKHTNLVLHFPNISRARWYVANPNDPGRKSCNWYLTASALWFQDGLDILR